jgi:6,7-dimethyl-8-ribityllumazine synthase
MPQVYEGRIAGDGKKMGIVVGRFNDFISNKLLEGALDALVRHGVNDGDIDVIKVPGSFEIPLMAKKMSETGKYDAVICLGAVIRGSTPHFEYVSAEVSKGVAQVALDSGVPVIFGVITTDTLEQAIERAGTKSGNKGWAAAVAALDMANLVESVAGA